MTTFEQWNYGYGQRVILPSIKRGIINYEKEDHSSFDYAFAHHVQTILLCNKLLTKEIEFYGNWPRWWRIYIIRFVSSTLDIEAPIKRQRLHVGIL